MSQADREKWNAKYRERAEGAAPSDFVTGLASLLRPGARALDLAGGRGRHALWLARQGLRVTLADVSDVALEGAARIAAAEGLALTTLQIDLETASFPAGEWDMIVCSFFLHRPLFAALPAALAPGGLLAIAHPTRKNLERHEKPGADFLLEEGELGGLIHGLEIVQYDEAWRASERHEARLIARRA